MTVQPACPLPIHPTLAHPSGAPVVALGFSRTGLPIWPVRGGAPDDDEGEDKGDDDGSGNSSDGDADGDIVPGRDFPEQTPRKEMTPDQEMAYWKHLAQRREKDLKARSGNPAELRALRAKAAEADRLRQERETENEKAVREAGEKASADERAKTAPRLVSAEFRAAAKGVLSTEQRDALLEDLDLTKYLTDTGEVDVAKVEKKVAALAPKADDGKGKRNFPDLGQGKRESKPAAGVASGKEMYEARRGTKAAS